MAKKIIERMVCTECWHIWDQKQICCPDKYCRCGSSAVIGRRLLTSLVQKMKELRASTPNVTVETVCEIAIFRWLHNRMTEQKFNEVLTKITELADEWDPNTEDAHIFVEQSLVKLK